MGSYAEGVRQFFPHQQDTKEHLNQRGYLNPIFESHAFHRKMYRNRNRIVRAEKSQPIPQKQSLRTIYHSLRIYPYPMVWPLPRPWSETMVSIPLSPQKAVEIKGFLGLERPFLDLVSQTPRPRGRGRPLFVEQFDRVNESQTSIANHRRETVHLESEGYQLIRAFRVCFRLPPFFPHLFPLFPLHSPTAPPLFTSPFFLRSEKGFPRICLPKFWAKFG